MTRRGFDADIIELCVRWYISYRPSYRDRVELMADREGLGKLNTAMSE